MSSPYNPFEFQTIESQTINGVQSNETQNIYNMFSITLTDIHSVQEGIDNILRGTHEINKNDQGEVTHRFVNFKITSFPLAYLVISLQRCTFDPISAKYYKNTSRVEINDEIILTSINGQKMKYKLIGTIIHCGNDFQEGHYICLLKNNGKYLEFNDSRVFQITEERFYFLSNSDGDDGATLAFYSSTDRTYFAKYLKPCKYRPNETVVYYPNQKIIIPPEHIRRKACFVQCFVYPIDMPERKKLYKRSAKLLPNIAYIIEPTCRGKIHIE